MAILTESQLRKIIKEQLQIVINEGEQVIPFQGKSITPKDVPTHIAKALEILDKYTEVAGPNFDKPYEEAYKHLAKAIQLAGGNLTQLGLQENKK